MVVLLGRLAVFAIVLRWGVVEPPLFLESGRRAVEASDGEGGGEGEVVGSGPRGRWTGEG